MRQLGEGKGHCRRKREMIAVVKLATARWARWVRKATRSSVRASRPQWGPLPTPLPLPHRRHRKHWLGGNADLAGSAEFPANTAFAARAAIAVAAVRYRQRYGQGAPLWARRTHAAPGSFTHPPRPPRGCRLDYPDHLPPLLAMALAFPELPHP